MSQTETKIEFLCTFLQMTRIWSDDLNKAFLCLDQILSIVFLSTIYMISCYFKPSLLPE